MSKKKPDLVVWTEERGYYQGQLTYGSNLGAPAIKLEDVDGWKKTQAMDANKHFVAKYEELRKEFDSMLEEVHWNDVVYQSQYSFIPIIGDTYHLYKRVNGTTFLSFIDPTSWKMEFLGSFRLDSNKKWNKI